MAKPMCEIQAPKYHALQNFMTSQNACSDCLTILADQYYRWNIILLAYSWRKSGE